MLIFRQAEHNGLRALGFLKSVVREQCERRRKMMKKSWEDDPKGRGVRIRSSPCGFRPYKVDVYQDYFSTLWVCKEHH
jgi:hypothetical protein